MDRVGLTTAPTPNPAPGLIDLTNMAGETSSPRVIEPRSERRQQRSLKRRKVPPPPSSNDCTGDDCAGGESPVLGEPHPSLPTMLNVAIANTFVQQLGVSGHGVDAVSLYPGQPDCLSLTSWPCLASYITASRSKRARRPASQGFAVTQHSTGHHAASTSTPDFAAGVDSVAAAVTSCGADEVDAAAAASPGFVPSPQLLGLALEAVPLGSAELPSPAEAEVSLSPTMGLAIKHQPLGTPPSPGRGDFLATSRSDSPAASHAGSPVTTHSVSCERLAAAADDCGPFPSPPPPLSEPLPTTPRCPVCAVRFEEDAPPEARTVHVEQCLANDESEAGGTDYEARGGANAAATVGNSGTAAPIVHIEGPRPSQDMFFCSLCNKELTGME